MNKIKVEDLKAGISFNKPVYIDGNDLLLGSFEPLKKSDFDKLEKWKVEFVYTDGKAIKPNEVEQELKDLAKGLEDITAPDISELYAISSSNIEEINAAKQHLETIQIVKENYNLARLNKPFNVDDLRSAATSVIGIVTNNRRIVFKLIMISPENLKDFLFYQAVNTGLLTAMTALSLKYSKLQLINLILGAFLHDIGMVRVPGNIIHKKEKLDELEKRGLKAHPIYGHKIVEYTNSFPSDVSLIVLQHHERLDGSGYPHQLKGRQIGEYARIVAICDTYQAMCNKREYRAAQSPPIIMKSLLQQGVGKLDPNIMKIFAFTVGIYPVGLLVELTNGCIGEVMLQNIKALTKPVVKLYQDKDGKRFSPSKVINLALSENLDVKRVLNNEERKTIFRKMGGI